MAGSGWLCARRVVARPLWVIAWVAQLRLEVVAWGHRPNIWAPKAGWDRGSPACSRPTAPTWSPSPSTAPCAADRTTLRLRRDPSYGDALPRRQAAEGGAAVLWTTSTSRLATSSLPPLGRLLDKAF